MTSWAFLIYFYLLTKIPFSEMSSLILNYIGTIAKAARCFFFFFSCTLFHQKWSTPISVPSISGEISPFICKHLHFFVTLLQHLQCLIDRGSQQYTFISFIQVIQFCNLHIETLKSVLLVNYNNAYYLRKKFVQRKQRALLYISAHT